MSAEAGTGQVFARSRFLAAVHFVTCTKKSTEVKKKLREIEKIEELQKDGAVLEANQRQKVQLRS